MTEGQIKRRRTAAAIVIGALIVALALTVYGTVVLQQVSGIERQWRERGQLAQVQDETLFRLQSSLGYGGFIHHFKNFVLRSELDSFDAARHHLQEASDALDALIALGVAETHPDKIQLIRELIEAYKIRMVIADEAFVAGYTANQIDGMVRIDDAAAMMAITDLSGAIHDKMLATQAESSERLDAAIRTSTLGLLILPLIGVVAWLMLRFLREQTEANQREKAAAAQIATIIDTNPEAMLLIDRHGRVVRTNDAATTLLGYQRQELIGMPIAKIAPTGAAGTWKSDVLRLFDEPGGRRVWRGVKLWAIRSDGLRIPVGVSAGVSGDDDHALVTMLLSDETPRLNYETGLIEAREAAERASRAKSDFLANVSHEVRTPINAIIGLSGLAGKTSLSPQQNDYITKIHSAGRRLLDVVNDMLDFARIDAGKMELVEHPFPLANLLEQIATIAAVGAEEKGLEVVFRLDRDIPKRLNGDQNRIAQVLSGLINNAIKFTDKGAVVVDVRLSSPASSGPGDPVTLMVGVSDTGIGIAADDLPYLFEAFSQVDMSTQRVHGGTGLGLAICKNLVESMGGELTAESEPGKGSTFRFTAQLKLTDENGAAEAPMIEEATRVLVIDDSASVRDILATELGGAGFTVTSAADGAAGIDLVRERLAAGEPFDVVLIDREMPGTDGVAAVSQLVDALGAEPMPMILLMASFDSVNLREIRSALPIAGVLEKPVITSVLVGALIDAVNQRDGIELVQPARQDRNVRADTAEARSDQSPRSAKRREMNAGEIRFAAFMGDGDAKLLGRAASARVLVVEDNLINQQVAVEMLDHLGIASEIADNGLAALNKLRENPVDHYDLVLMDVQMPGMDGVTATKHIRGDSRFAGLPIIALTAHALGDDRERCFDAGMDGHLTKPIGPRQLIAVLNAWVGTEGGIPKNAAPDTAQVVTAETAAQDEVAPADQPLFDEDRLESLRELSDGFLEKMLGDFRTRFGDAARQVRGLLAESKIEEARSLAHTIKGTSGSLGAQRLFASARALDLALRAKEPEDAIAVLTDQFEEALDQTCATIAEDLAPEPASAAH